MYKCFLSLFDWKTTFILSCIVVMTTTYLMWKEATWVCWEVFAMTGGFVSCSILLLYGFIPPFYLQMTFFQPCLAILKYYWRRRRIHPPLCWCDFSSLSHGETQLAMAWSWMEGVIRFTSSASSGGGCKTHSKWIVGITLPSWYRYFNQSRHVWLYRVVYKLLPRMIWGES